MNQFGSYWPLPRIKTNQRLTIFWQLSIFSASWAGSGVTLPPSPLPPPCHPPPPPPSCLRRRQWWRPVSRNIVFPYLLYPPIRDICIPNPIQIFRTNWIAGRRIFRNICAGRNINIMKNKIFRNIWIWGIKCGETQIFRNIWMGNSNISKYLYWAIHNLGITNISPHRLMILLSLREIDSNLPKSRNADRLVGLSRDPKGEWVGIGSTFE